MKERENWIDFTKGIAILLVVIGHVNSGLRESTVFINHKGFLDYVDFTIYNFHMPLFFAISGYLYSKTTTVDNFEGYKNSIIKKVISLGIPYTVFSLSYCLIKLMFSKYVNKGIDINILMQIPFKPIEFLWFLYALIGVFILVLTLDFKIKNKYLNLIILISLFISTYLFDTSVAILNYTFKYSFYFYLGKILQCKSCVMKSNKVFIISIILSIITNILVYYRIADLDILKVVFAISLSYVVFVASNKLQNNNCINFLGKSTLQIYLIHVPICSATRVILIKLGMVNIIINYILGVSLGIGVSLLIYSLIKRVKLLDFCIYPTRYIRTLKRYR